MGLDQELKLFKPLQNPEHEGFLNICYTATWIKKAAMEFLQPFGLTDVQLNLLMMLRHQGGQKGLSQARISELLVAGRANITGLVDRLERDGLVRRTNAPGDRRYNIVCLTPKAEKVLDKIEPLYTKRVHEIMSSLSKQKLSALIESLETVRQKLK